MAQGKRLLGARPMEPGQPAPLEVLETLAKAELKHKRMIEDEITKLD